MLLLYRVLMLCIYGSVGVIHVYPWCLFSSEDDTEVNWSWWKPYTGQIYDLCVLCPFAFSQRYRLTERDVWFGSLNGLLWFSGARPQSSTHACFTAVILTASKLWFRSTEVRILKIDFSRKGPRINRAMRMGAWENRIWSVCCLFDMPESNCDKLPQTDRHRHTRDLRKAPHSKWSKRAIYAKDKTQINKLSFNVRPQWVTNMENSVC